MQHLNSETHLGALGGPQTRSIVLLITPEDSDEAEIQKLSKQPHPGLLQLTVSGRQSSFGPAAADDNADVVVNVELVADALGVATPKRQAIKVLLKQKF